MKHPEVSNGGAWTLGVKIGLPAAILAVIILVVVGVLFALAVKKADPFDKGLIRGCSIGSFLVAVGVTIGCLFAYFPYSAEYHQYRPVTGTVEKVSSRFLASGEEGGGSDQKFVVQFKGSDQAYGVNDTRASLVKPGDTIAINCIRTFEYGSTDGYDCKWGGKGN